MKVPPVFAGGRLLVYGFPKTSERPAAVRLSATGLSRPLAVEVSLANARITRGKSVATLAARARIRELEEGGEWLASRGSLQQERKHNSVRREIIELSVRYSLISRETSFVAVERRETPVTGDIQLRRVPIVLTDGWGGVKRQFVGVMPAALAPRTSRLTLDGDDTASFVFGRAQQPQERASKSGSRVFDSLRLPRALRGGRRQDVATPTGMHALVALQRADGSWELTSDLADILGRRFSDIKVALDGATGADIRRAWATALAMAWLHLHAADLEDQWRLLGRKARRWLEDVAAIAPGGVSWIDAATRFLSA
jgi:hypothetical protein